MTLVKAEISSVLMSFLAGTASLGAVLIKLGFQQSIVCPEFLRLLHFHVHEVLLAVSQLTLASYPCGHNSYLINSEIGKISNGNSK